MSHKFLAALIVLNVASLGFAQFGRGGGDWLTVGADAQRTADVKTDPHISVESVEAGVMQPLWKFKLSGVPTPPVVSSRLITYKGFKDLIYVGTSADTVTAIDHVLGKTFWETHLPYDSLLTPVKTGTATCPAGMTSAVSMLVPLAPPEPGAGRGRGRGGYGFGGPGGGRGMATNLPTLPRPKRTPGSVYAVSSDGLIHSLNEHTGLDLEPAARFIRGNAKVHDVISISNVVYAVTTDGCGGTPNGVWSVDLKDNMVNQWKTGEALVSGIAFSEDGKVFATTSDGLASLTQKTLELKQQHAGAFSTAPLTFKMGKKEYVAAGGADGHLVVLDASTMAAVSDAVAGNGNFAGALATFEDSGKTRWILAAKGENIVAFKVAAENGSIALRQGWTSRELVSPAAPIVVNGVVFALSSGSRTAPAVLYALNGMTGKELWSSGRAIQTYSTGGISAGASKIYVGTHDGTLYAFGYLLDRN